MGQLSSASEPKGQNVVITCKQVRGATCSGLRCGRVSAAERVVAPIYTSLGPPKVIWKCACDKLVLIISLVFTK